MDKLKKQFKRKEVLIPSIIGVVVIIGIAVYMGIGYTNQQTILKAMNIQFNEEKKEVEYGSEFDTKELVVKVENGEIKEYPTIDTKEVGEKKLVFTITKDKIKKEVEHTVQVVDTKAPEITLKQERVEVKIKDKIDLKSNIKSVKDVVDGEIPFKEKEEENANNGYVVKGNVDTSKVGEYKVEVIAIDKNGLKANKTFVVAVVEEKKEEQNSANVNNGTQAQAQKPNNSTRPNVQSKPQGQSKPQVQPSKPSTPNTPPQQTCRPGVPIDISNSGMFWAGNTDESFDKADKWADEETSNRDSKWYIYSYLVRPAHDDCGYPIGYTVYFYY